MVTPGDPYVTKRLFKYWFGSVLIVSCLNPEDVKIILNSPHCLEKPRFIYSSIANFALLTISGEEYKVHRKAITPLFTPKSLKNLLPLVNQAANEFLTDFDKTLNGSIFDISFDTLDFALNSTLRSFFNINDIDRRTRTKLLEHLSA
jgi:cytochrome P450 family 313